MLDWYNVQTCAIFYAFLCHKITVHCGVWNTPATQQYEQSQLCCEEIHSDAENELGTAHLNSLRPNDAYMHQ